MNIYTRKIRIKYILLIVAILIGGGSLWYTNQLVEDLANEERKKAETWAEATRLIVDTEIHNQGVSPFIMNILENNETIPVVILDSDGNVTLSRNIDSVKMSNPKYVERLLKNMMEENEVIPIDLIDDFQYLYYDRSIILKKLTYYPYIQLTVILLFILAAYFAFNSSRKAEQNQVWVGLSKETAHQLGTPISSLMAWLEIIKMKLGDDEELGKELEKDVLRLEKITERFSKIGSKPHLKNEDLNDAILSSVNYLRTRSSDKIKFVTSLPDTPVILPLNLALFEWVIENICKNAMDAIENEGTIKLTISDNNSSVFLDIKDNGKGVPRNKLKTIFKPGYTTKERGWGLGLSLTKRIVEEYHEGKIFVSDSMPGSGTTFRIILNR